MKVLNIFFIVLFVFSAALQYNDPDPYVWMPIYLYAAVLCFLAIRGKYSVFMYLSGLLFYLAYMASLFINTNGVLSWWNDHQAESLVESMVASKPWIEETREFFGLAILVASLLTNMAWLSSRVERTSPVTGMKTATENSMS